MYFLFARSHEVLIIIGNFLRPYSLATSYQRNERWVPNGGSSIVLVARIRRRH